MQRTPVAKRLLLAGASALAILVGAADADAASWDLPGIYTFTVTATGVYAVDVVGAHGGDGTALGFAGGAGAEVKGDLTLTKGDSLSVVVGGEGKQYIWDGGGGGFSLIERKFGSPFLVIGGGGGGAGFLSNGGNGQTGVNGAAGGGKYGGAGGVSGSGGGGGSTNFGVDLAGGGGAGFAGAGGNAVGGGGQGGNGATGGGSAYAQGGFAGGGGAGAFAGGGGAGASGGGGGGGIYYSSGFVGLFEGYGGGGGGSAAFGLSNPTISVSALTGDGYVSLNSVPEASTWAMMLAGFSALGLALRRRTNHAAPAA